MLIPSIDISQGDAVQWIEGRDPALNAGDPTVVAERFGRLGSMAVIDLDAALGRGSNQQIIEALCRRFRCRVGGGIRDLATARRWLDAGAEQIIIGTAAEPEFVSQLPRERVIAALDARDGEVVVDGWRQGTGRGVIERMEALRDYVSGFLVTFVECEGRMEGTRLDLVSELVAAAGDARLTIAGGVTHADDIRALDQMGADAQVGMALYTGRLDLGEAFTAALSSDRADGLWPTVIVDQHQRALGLAYSNLESLQSAIESGEGVYWSRSRGLWRKGSSSGATQELLGIDVDCDRDTLRFTVRQRGDGFCHLGTLSCWGPLGGIPSLVDTIRSRVESAPAASYTQRLFNEPGLLQDKLVEEAQELADAADSGSVRWETADVLYFTLVSMVKAGVSLESVEDMLGRRSQRVSRRAGDAKVRATR